MQVRIAGSGVRCVPSQPHRAWSDLNVSEGVNRWQWRRRWRRHHCIKTTHMSTCVTRVLETAVQCTALQVDPRWPLHFARGKQIGSTISAVHAWGKLAPAGCSVAMLAASDATCERCCHSGCVDRGGVEGVRRCSAIALELVLAQNFRRVKKGHFAAISTVVVWRASKRPLALL